MVDLSTDYLGMELKTPLVPSASPLSRDLDSARRLEDAGAGALVMYSLFEEEVRQAEESTARFLHEQAIGFGEADSFLPEPDSYINNVDAYLEQLARLKAALDIPVIASLNGVSDAGWVRYARLLEEAGADALELNVYYIAADIHQSAAEVESRYIEMLHAVRQQVSLPVAMKLSSQFSSVGHLAGSLEAAGAAGVVLFNRFYQPDIDLETREVVPSLTLSSSHETLLRIHWAAILHGRTRLALAVSGGFHTAADSLKAIMAGADVVQLCSVLLQQGPEELGRIHQGMLEWMEAHEYDSVRQMRGCVSHRNAIDPAAYERANYVKVLENYTAPRGVWR
ncbi:dihydroorotate dehydrogenase-like protein [Thiohalobacter thiocyanaticus]|uniref:Dihydroorotate dehydrogenase-like protein n=1 Tax=Thiohalobacter thiocyanaticus TaxID=585455 RepID=A0A426QH38_9GAMM|nr:dihydroorotate dehydrogenase-like protein [Thiohalobacter thiocyanaticus]RRQ21078.1 dihydroorotate dehydrogenase-like protein [Thiohalobacter thiocyanaticus]